MKKVEKNIFLISGLGIVLGLIINGAIISDWASYFSYTVIGLGSLGLAYVLGKNLKELKRMAKRKGLTRGINSMAITLVMIGVMIAIYYQL